MSYTGSEEGERARPGKTERQNRAKKRRKEGNKKMRHREHISMWFSEGRKSVFLLWLKCIFGSDQGWCLKRFILHHLLKIALNFFLCPRLSDMRSETRGTSVSSPTLLRLPRSQVIREGEDKKEPHLMNTKLILLFNSRRTHTENSISLPNTIRETDSGCVDVALCLWARCIPGDRACKECIIKSEVRFDVENVNVRLWPAVFRQSLYYLENHLRRAGDLIKV